MTSIFAADHAKIWQYRYRTTILVTHQAGAIPNDPAVIRGWLKSRLIGKEGTDQHLADMIAQTMLELDIDEDEAINKTSLKLNKFKRDKGGLVFEGRCIKALLKEAFNVAGAGGHVPTGQVWGKASGSKKGLLGFVAEHVMVPDVFIPLFKDGTQMSEPDETNQRFVSVYRGQGIVYEEIADQHTLSFDVISDFDFDKYWPQVWTMAEELGVGAARSMGSGRFEVQQWDRVDAKPVRRRKAS